MTNENLNTIKPCGASAREQMDVTTLNASETERTRDAGRVQRAVPPRTAERTLKQAGEMAECVQALWFHQSTQRSHHWHCGPNMFQTPQLRHTISKNLRSPQNFISAKTNVTNAEHKMMQMHASETNVVVAPIRLDSRIGTTPELTR